jgi:hypothetical protein
MYFTWHVKTALQPERQSEVIVCELITPIIIKLSQSGEK